LAIANLGPCRAAGEAKTISSPTVPGCLPAHPWGVRADGETPINASCPHQTAAPFAEHIRLLNPEFLIHPLLLLLFASLQ
jgi:hypothetical protein